MRSHRLLEHAQRLQAIAQSGIAYPTTPYELERYLEVRQISVALLQELTDEPYDKIVRTFASETGYQTPKIDIRAIVFRGADEILMVREKVDRGRWTPPGGWADIGLTPFEVAAKEAQEESGLSVKPVRLLAVFDKKKHAHPAQPWYVYKMFILCEVISGELLQETAETGGAQWFHEHQLDGLELSTDRITLEQLQTLFQFARDPDLPTMCD
jgi:ADP-ribose pyrophosphatase YjhB (NUDIX family)